MKRTLIHVLTIFLLIFSLLTPGLTLPSQSAATTPKDIEDHWAYSYIARGIELGFISGYPDGTFLPDKAVSRAEFAKMINAALGNTGTTSITFDDVPTFEWFYDDVSKAVAATYVDGYGDGTFLPNKAISRQEAAVMIARIVPSYGATSNLNAYVDGGNTADWAIEYVEKIVGKAYLGPYDDGLLHPEDCLTRAQTAKIICNILDKETIVKTFTTIKEDDSIINNTLYTNTVTISKDLEEGDVSLQNCSLLGGLLVNGGGSNSITLENSRIAKLSVNKSGATVHIIAKGATVIPQTTSQEICSLETLSLTGGTFGKGFIFVDIRRNADTTFTGYFPLINLIGANGIARLDGCYTDKLIVSSDASASNIYLDSRSTLAATDVNSLAAFHGTGTIKQMNANVSGITYEVIPTNWTLASGVIAPKEANPDLQTIFIPSNGAAEIPISVNPTISFLTEIETFDGNAITTSYLNDNLVFKKGSASGNNVEFSAALSSNKKIITITPTANLESDQIYYIGFTKDTYRSIDSNESIAANNIVFTTVNTAPTASINPANGAIQVTTNASLKITFSEAIFNSTGAAPSSSYLADNIILVKGSGGSNLNTSSASISGNVVSIPSPSIGWEEGISYTITVNSGSFRNAAGNYVAQTASTFIVGTTPPITIINSLDLDSTNITINAEATIPGSSYFLVTENTTTNITPSAAQIKNGQDSTGTSVPSVNGSIGTSSSNFIINGLSSGKSYTLYGLTNSNGKDSVIVTKDFTTPLPTALNTLVYSYTPSGGTTVNTSISISDSMNINIPQGASNISITATALSDFMIAFSATILPVSPVFATTSLSTSIDMTTLALGASQSITITTSKTSYANKTYILTLTKTAS